MYRQYSENKSNLDYLFKQAQQIPNPKIIEKIKKRINYFIKHRDKAVDSICEYNRKLAKLIKISEKTVKFYVMVDELSRNSFANSFLKNYAADIYTFLIQIIYSLSKKITITLPETVIKAIFLSIFSYCAEAKSEESDFFILQNYPLKNFDYLMIYSISQSLQQATYYYDFKKIEAFLKSSTNQTYN